MLRFALASVLRAANPGFACKTDGADVVIGGM
jgi:hypothetical protein